MATALILTGCNAGEGSVQVDVGDAPLAAAYRVDLYAREAGLDLVEGVYLTQANQVTLNDVPEGEWALLIQAQNGDLTTIGHFQAQIRVNADQTTSITAGAYRPGLPGDPIPETTTTIASFGPNGEALLTALYGPGIDSLPAAPVDLEIVNGEGEVTPDDQGAVNRAVSLGGIQPQCGTCFISAQDVDKANDMVLAQEARPQLGTINPGETTDFFVVTTFQTVTCERVLNDTQTENCLIFAQQVNGTPVISEARALEIAQGFDSDNPFQDGDAGIYADTRSRFGSEWKASGGRDGDERVVLVFLSSDSIGGSGLFGFFNPTDQRSKADSSSSNEGEILYINAERANADLYDALGTIAHELVHLIVYNAKVAQEGAFPEGAVPENAVLDEGLAVLNEELSGFTYTGDQGGNFFLLSSVDGLLSDGLNRRFFQFGGSLSDYGAGYLFWRFVHDQLGLATITTLATSTGTGRENVATALGDETFAQFFERFVQAVALHGRTDLDPEFQFSNLDLFATYSSREGTDFELAGLQNIRTVTLPGTLEVTDSLEPWGTIFYLVSGGDGSELTWKAAGAEGLAAGSVSLTP